MQIVYDIHCSLAEYCKKVARGKWVYPSYTGIAHKHGAYYRKSYGPKGILGEIRIQRYRYKRPGKGAVTFSLLVKGCMPYSKYSVSIATQALTTWADNGWSIFKAMENMFTLMEEASEELLNIGIAQMYRFKKMFEGALMKYAVWKKYGRSAYTFDKFVRNCGEQEYLNSEALSVLYYEGNGGLDNLKPMVRSDKGIVRRITEQAAQHIRETIKEFPFLSGSGIYRMLTQRGSIRPGDFGETTLRNYIKLNELRKTDENNVGRKKYEKANVNELWVSDFMHGPYLQIGKRKRKTYLCAIIDDHSRIIVGAGWYLNENSSTLAATLKNAINVFGLPQVFYCDNGSVFVSSYLNLVCAKLGIALVHSRPYDSPSRGKIERFFRTVREKFLAAVSGTIHLTIEELNFEFDKWLDTQYHKQCHGGINERPIDRYFGNAAKNKIKTIPEHELDNCFLNVIRRKVKKDSTVSINKKFYEVPPSFIGKIVEMTFPIDQPDTITLMDNGKPVARIKPVNVHENANKPYTGIHFKNFIVD